MVLLVGAGATLRADTVDLPITLEISALIDGRDQLIIQGDTLQWHHFDFAAVGRHLGKTAYSSDIAPVLPSALNTGFHSK